MASPRTSSRSLASARTRSKWCAVGCLFRLLTPARYAQDVVRECADAWEKLVTGKTQRGEISLANVTNASSPDRVDQAQLNNIPKGEELPHAPIDGSVDKWFFISGAAV